MGTSDEARRCCYLFTDFKELENSWCSKDIGSIDPLSDAVALLSECSDSLKGSMDDKPTEFASAHYKGVVK